MATYTVAADGTTSPSSPAFPSSPINDVLLPDGTYDTSAATGSAATVYIDGTYQLQSLSIGAGIEVDLGAILGGNLTGTGSITGSNDPNSLAPAFVSFGLVDINGAIDVAFTNSSQLTVSTGERLDLEGDLNRFGAGASTVSVASGAELDVNSLTIARLNALSSQGTVKITAPNTYISGATALAGTVTVQGDALNGLGSGTLVPRASSSYVAAVDLRSATFAAPITSLTLLQDAQLSVGSVSTTVQRLSIAGSSTAQVPLDVVSVDGTLLVSGNGSGAANQVAIALAEFTGGGTVDFTVAATDGGASLQQQLVVDANTTLRNDATMAIGGQGTAATTIGAASAAAGSVLINGASGQLTIAARASLSVAAIQNAGAITVAGTSSFLQPLTNTGTIDVASGTLSLEAASQGAGTIAVENGATLSIDAASQGNIALRTGALLRLSQPTAFTSTIQAPATGAKIDLAGLTATSATVSNGAIVVTTSGSTVSLAETGLINGTTLAFGSDGVGGSLLTVSAAGATSTTPPTTQSHPAVYRFFDDIHGTQFLTASLSETQMLQATRPDLVYEGVGLTSFDPATDPNAAPVYRFFDTKFGTHFYTDSATERDTVLATRPDLVSEGIGFYEHTTPQAGDTPVYRFFDSNAGTHFYTASASEQASIVATRPDLISEGIGFYAPSTSSVA